MPPTPPATRNRPGQQAFFYGWGQTERDHPSAPLQIGVVALQPAAACPHSAITLCGKGLGSAGAAQCHGDSGGPLVMFDDRVPTLIGIVSHNQGLAKCGENPAPGVFTRIAPFRGWIEGLTGKLAVPIERGESRAP